LRYLNRGCLCFWNEKIKHFLSPLLTITLLLLLSGCASIVSDSQYPVSINSNPPGAQVSVLDEAGAVVFTGKTPTIVTLKSGTSYFNGADYQIIAKSADGQERRESLSSSVDGWYVGNLGFGGLIGFLIVDPLTGAMYKLPDSKTIHFSSPVEQREVKAISKGPSAPEAKADEVSAGA
jgi:uncharacterized protein YceK